MVKKLLILPALALGVLVVFLMMQARRGPQLEPPGEVATPVRVLAVPRTELVPRATGYGEVRAGRVWQAVPQVGGRIVELSPRVKEGSFVEEDAVLVRIDRADYELDVKVAQARIQALDAQLRETTTREATITASLGIEKSSLELAEVELGRIRELVGEGTVPEADLDRESRNVLNQKLRVQEIENSMTLLGPQREVLKAQREQEASNLERAKLALERTVIRAPFPARIGTVNVEQDQVVQPGQVLFSADTTELSEVTAWLPLRGVRRVLAAGTAEVEAITGAFDVQERLDLAASIRVAAGAHAFAWTGEVVRIRGIDSQTRALGLDVAVRDPYAGIVPGRKPPLVPGLYVEVEILAPPRPGAVVIPRSALHEDFVYLVGEDDRLVRRPVRIEFVQEELAVVGEGLDGGETLVLTDLVPAVEGSLLAPVADAEAQAVLVRAATSAADAR